MPSTGRSTTRLLALLVLFGVATVAVSSVPTVTVGTHSIRTSFAVGVVGGSLLVPAVVSHYRGGERRDALQWGLFAVGVPLSLTDHAFLPLVGVLAILGSLGVGRRSA